MRVTASTGLAQGSEIDIITDSKKQDDPVGGRHLFHPLPGGCGSACRMMAKIEAAQVESDGTVGSVLTLRDVSNSGRPSYAQTSSRRATNRWPFGKTGFRRGQEIISGIRVADSSGGSTTGDLFPISPYYTRREYVASAPGPDNDYLLAWQQASDSPEPDIFVQRIDSQGQATGSLITITTHLAAQERPALARGDNEYFIVWQDQRNAGTSGSDLYGHILNNSGALSGTLITITTASDDQIEPTIAYNSDLDEYLVLWSDYRNGSTSDIYGQIVGSDGTLGGTVDISGISNHQKLADVVYNPDQAQYLTVWQDHRGSNNPHLYGQIISPDGTLVSSEFGIVETTVKQRSPAIAYNSAAGASGRYLVVWDDERNGAGNRDVYGHLIESSGSLTGSDFAIAVVSDKQEETAITVLDSDEFLIAWQDLRNGWPPDIYAQRLDGDGALLDESDTAADESTTGNHITIDDGADYFERPAVSFNPDLDIALIAWNNWDNGGIYTARYSVTNPLTPTASFTATPTSGVVPLIVTVTDASSGIIASRQWDFGDGTITTTTSTDPLSHTYIATGTFTVLLTVTTPGSSDTASELITVTAQITPDLHATGSITLPQDFAEFDLGDDPTFWLDQEADTTDRDDYQILWSGESEALGTEYTGSSIVYSHYAIPGSDVWDNYEYTGKLKVTDDGEIGVSVYSSYPQDEQKAYLLYRQANGGFQLGAVGSTLEEDILLEVTPTVDSWYQFRIQIGTETDGVSLRAKVWLDGQSEPADWQAFAIDTSGSRLTAGTVGVRSTGAGNKYFDDLKVEPLSEPLASFTADPLTGEAPLGVTMTNLSVGATSYRWDFGDGGASLLDSPVHTYTQNGVYTVSLLAGDGIATDTLTRTAYLIVGVATTTNLIEVGDLWSYFKGQSAPPSTWADVTFDDSSWLTGTTGIGYGDGDDSTVLSDMQGSYVSVFARRVFTLTNPALVTSMTLEIDYDDGFVAYLNGTEVARGNMTDIEYDDTANGNHEAGTPEYFSLNDYLDLLQSGDNVLAVQGHNQALSSSDFSLIPALEAEIIDITPIVPIRDWSLVTTVLTPTVINEHAMTYDTDRQRVVLYGGNATGFPYSTTTWELTGTTWVTTTDVGPTARYGAQMAYDGTEIILFGGSDENDVALGETWRYTNTTWSEMSISGFVPVTRTHHSIASNPSGGKVYIFGGNDGAQAYLNDVWIYNNGNWTESAPNNSPPVARTLAALTYNNNHLYLFGGRNITGTILSDLWDYNLGTAEWSLLDGGGGAGPPVRMGHSLTYDPDTGNLVLVAGTNDDGDTLLGDTWHFNQGWTNANPTTSLTPRAYHQALYTDNAIVLFSDGEVWKYE